jgi:hypothetical protein
MQAMQPRAIDLEGIDADGLGHSITISGPYTPGQRRRPRFMVRVPKIQLPWQKKQTHSDPEELLEQKTESFWHVSTPRVTMRDSVNLEWEPSRNPEMHQPKVQLEPYNVKDAVDKFNAKYGYESCSLNTTPTVPEAVEMRSIASGMTAPTVAIPASVVGSLDQEEVNYTRYSTATEESFPAHH